jgi:hypothetical protein
LKVEDQYKTAFITPYGVFCYETMSFWLKKQAGATYQQMMRNCLGDQIGRNIHVYIDDVVIITKHEAPFIGDLRETFATSIGMTSNLTRQSVSLVSPQRS